MKKVVKVTHRLYNRAAGRFEFHHAGCFKTYAEAVRHFGGSQSSFDKEWHRFTLDGDLYTMQRVEEGDVAPSRSLMYKEIKPVRIESTTKYVI